MKIVAHRGYWTNYSDQNSSDALLEAARRGFEIETDIRDHMGELVVSHDPPTSNELLFEDLVHSLSKISTEVFLAINVKSDGLAPKLRDVVDYHSNIKFVFFDMSGPEHFKYKRAGLDCLSRVSEFENPYALSEKLWIDSFLDDEFSLNKASEMKEKEQDIYFVSPELHGREEKNLWRDLKKLNLGDNFRLCTDFPDSAREFFKK